MAFLFQCLLHLQVNDFNCLKLLQITGTNIQLLKKEKNVEQSGLAEQLLG